MTNIEISPATARELTDRIKVGVDAIWELIKQAYTSRAWSVLGYSSWDDYCTREFGTSRIRLPREERQEVVASMREIGMSTRAIASATGMSNYTASKDAARARELTPGAEPAPVTGTDGKTYTPRPRTALNTAHDPDDEIVPGMTAGQLDELNVTPSPELATPTKPRRGALTEDANRIGWEIRKAVERLESLMGDDRYHTNQTKVTPLLRGHLQYAIEVTTTCLANLTGEDQ